MRICITCWVTAIRQHHPLPWAETIISFRRRHGPVSALVWEANSKDKTLLPDQPWRSLICTMNLHSAFIVSTGLPSKHENLQNYSSLWHREDLSCKLVLLYSFLCMKVTLSSYLLLHWLIPPSFHHTERPLGHWTRAWRKKGDLAWNKSGKPCNRCDENNCQTTIETLICPLEKYLPTASSNPVHASSVSRYGSAATFLPHSVHLPSWAPSSFHKRKVTVLGKNLAPC